MLMPVNILLSILFFPFVLILGMPKKIGIAKNYLMYNAHKKFPISSRTPVVYIKPHSWYGSFLNKNRIGGQAILCFMVIGDLADEKTEFHEALHIIQQSIFTPVLIGVIYMLDLLVYCAFHSFFVDRTWLHISVVEKTVRAVTGQDSWRKK